MDTIVGRLEVKIKEGICIIATSLKSRSAMIIYHGTVYGLLTGLAIGNGNNTFLAGSILAVFAFLGMILVGSEIDEHKAQNGMCRKLTKFFDLDSEKVTPHQYIWIMALPVTILLASSCLIFVHPIGPEKHVGIIERVNTGHVNIVHGGEAKIFIPKIHKARWFPLHQNISRKMTFKTEDKKTIQGTVKIDLLLADDDNNLAQVYRGHGGSQEQLLSDIEQAVKDAFSKNLSGYTLKTLPPQIVIEDLAGSGVDFKGLGVKSGTIKLSDIHRYFEVK